MKNTAPPGTLVISLDFELMWGMFDKVSGDTYGKNLTGVHTAIPELLTLFTQYNIHVTWATVGMLMFDNQADLEAHLPNILPSYTKSALSSYRHLAGLTANDPQHYFAPDLVRQILATPGQELASHTFSHYYCRESQTTPTEAVFRADCQSLTHIMSRFNTTPTSIVFPRNQWTEVALTTLAEYGVKAYRGTEQHFLYHARNEAAQTNPLIRALRLLDHYINLSGHHTYKLNAVNPASEHSLINIPASRFLRAYSKKLALFEPLRRHRIKRAMTYAAQKGEIFHLWWHPHNFGINQTQNFRTLEVLFKHYQRLQRTYSMQSCSMDEVRNSLISPGAPRMAKFESEK